MKSFTKFYVLMLAMLMSLGMLAQQMTPLEYQVLQQKAQLELQDHGPSVDVPMAPEGGRAVGDDCSNPIIVTLPANLPFFDLTNTTCGRGNTYSNSCMGSYDGGEDAHYQLIVTSPVWVSFVFDPVDTWGGIAIKDACGDAGTCLYLNTGSGNTARNFKYNFTTPGTYYIMVDTWPSPNCTGFALSMQVYVPPVPPTPITAFPAVIDFNSCSVPATTQLSNGSESHAVVNSNGVGGTCGVMLDGNTYVGWPYYSDGPNNFTYGPEHIAQVWMDVVPSGQPGLLTMLIDHRMNYSFANYYNWFRVRVNGTVIADKTGKSYFQPSSPSGDAWKTLEFDLTAFQGAPHVNVEIQNAGAYYFQYYQGGDATFVDNINIFYKEVGNVFGYCTMEMGAPAVGTEVGFTGEEPVYPPAIVDPTNGYYRFNTVPTTPNPTYEMYAFLDGQNYVVQTVTLVTGVDTQLDFNLSQPLMVISPVILEETMNPNEWRSVPISIVNGGDGALHWTAEIVFGPPPAMGSVATRIDPATPVAFQTNGDAKTSMLNDGSKPAPANITEGEMICTAEEPVFSGAPVGSDNGQGSEVGYGWLAGQHFTASGGPIGSIDWWGITFGTPPAQRPYRIIFYDNGATPPASNIIAQYDVLVDPIPTGVILYGNVFKYHVEFEEPADVEIGWVTIQSQASDGFIMYWMNTTSINASVDPPYFNLGGSVGPYAMCLGGSAGGGWLDLSAFEGDVAPNGGSGFVNALFDATGTVAGQVWTATINFTAEPNISTTPVAVSMIIAGEPLLPVTEFTAELSNPVTGAVQLEWTAPTNEITFEYYLIRRNGQPVANTTNTSYIDILPTYGVYNYTLSAVYAEGESVPAGPEEVIWLIPELCYTPASLSDSVWVGQSTTVTMTMENCGEGVLTFNFTDFDDPTHTQNFITAVNPYYGVVPEGESMEVEITYSAVFYGPGTYNTILPFTTNELAPNNERSILNTMIVYTPATLFGTVLDCNSGIPLKNVTITAAGVSNGKSFTSETRENGTYTMMVDAGLYDVTFSKLSYQSYTEDDVLTTTGVQTQLNAELCEEPYPVNWVLLDPNEEDTQAMITWSLPMGPYEIIYDDGEADNFFAWVQFGGTVAVKFTPAGYPATVVGGRLYVGDGSYPEGSNFIGQPMAIGVLAADGPGGFPGTVLDSIVVTVDNFGWVTFGGLSSTFETGNFYLAMWQLSIPPNTPPIGIDTDVPTVYRSYTRQAGQDWKVSTYQDFMFRAVVYGPGPNVVMAPEGAMVYPPKPTDLSAISMVAPSGMPGTEKMGEYKPVVMETADRGLVDYTVAFVDGFDPDAGETPMDGTMTTLTTTANNYYNHAGWGAKPAGFYAYAVRANYESSASVWTYSNVAAHLLDNELTLNISLCDGGDVSGASVVLHGMNFPYQHLTATTDASGVILFDSVIDGRYNLTVNKFGYKTYAYNDIYIMDDTELEVVLEQVTFPPRNLYVDPLTSVATWEAPIYIQVEFTDFEDATFPPAGWSKTSSGTGWFRSDNGGSSFWTIPAGDGFYAVANDDANSGNNGCCDYLITPLCNLTATADYNLYFYSFYNGSFGQQAYVEYTTDGGASWEEFMQLTPAASWTNLELDLSAISGQNGLDNVWFAFHADDNGSWASGWAVDNVELSDGAVTTVQGYQVFLDGGFVTETPADVLTYGYNDLQYGVTYTAAVAAVYCGLSEKIYYTWTSGYLYPPRNLDDAYIYNTNEVPLMWNPPMTGDGVPMAAATSTEYVHGIYEPSAGAAPLNGVAVSASGTPNPIMLNGFRAPTVYGVSNDIPAYASFDGEAPGTVTQIAPWPGGGNFANAAEIVVGSNGEEMYEVDNSGAARHINLMDGTVTSLGNVGVLANAMGLDYTTGIYYATDGNSLFTIDFDAVTSTNIGSLGSGAGNLMIGMTFDTDGNLYMYDIVIDQFWSCDKETGACTQIGSIGFDANFGQGMAWDQALGAPVMSAFNNGAFACEYRTVNVATGMSTFVGNIGTPGGTQFGTICIPVTSGPGGGGEVPDGLLSFNVYRDDAGLIGSAPYNGEDVEEFIHYVDNPVMPGTYLYNVTAVYDLGAYGFPGQTGESMMEGPDTVKVVWGFDIPFMEDWAQGSFGFNSWQTTASNWKINSQTGDGAPSAEFTWDPTPSPDYSVPLTSAPLNADMMTEGKIFLEYTIKLNDRNATGLENLKVEVYNGQEWSQVAQYSNTGSFDWTFNKVDITQYAKSRVFQVRFNATGANSFDIISWFVDNIYVYRMCDTPTKLEGMEYDLANGENGAKIKWNAPELPAPPQGWIHWDDGANFSGIGLDADAAFSVAARWAANTFPEFQGTSVTKVRVYAQDDGFTGWTLKIWSGANASTLLYSQVVTSQINVGAWTEITLTTPVPYDITKELWVGYTVDGLANFFPAGTDAGPAIVGFGDKVSLDGVVWEDLSGYGLNYNWNIQAYVEVVDGAVATIAPLTDNTVYSQSAVNLVRGAMKDQGVAVDNSGERAFTHFNIYRMTADETEYTLLDEVAWVEGQTAYEYYDNVSITPATYCYQVTAVWESETDFCESAPSPAKVNPMDDYVCFLVTDVNDPQSEGVFSMYPNPANDRVNITSSQSMKDITVYNYVGQVVFKSDLGQVNTMVLNTGNYEAGVYVVRINTENGVITKRVTITR